MALIRDGKPFFIYALVCPITMEVKYVGQTIDLEQRIRGSRHSMGPNTPLAQWLRTLGHLRPYKVILERGTNRRVELPKRHEVMPGKPREIQSRWLSSCLEPKWIKRFRRTILNKNKNIDVDRVLVNPPLPWDQRAAK